MSDRVLKESDVIREVKSLLVSDKMGYLNDLEYGNNQALCHVIDRIEDLPSAEWQEWIPCSERMPNKKEIVLITNDKGNVRFGQFRGTHGKYWIWKGNTLETVLAWMPLPKPWKGVDDEDN